MSYLLNQEVEEFLRRQHTPKTVRGGGWMSGSGAEVDVVGSWRKTTAA